MMPSAFVAVCRRRVLSTTCLHHGAQRCHLASSSSVSGLNGLADFNNNNNKNNKNNNNKTINGEHAVLSEKHMTLKQSVANLVENLTKQQETAMPPTRPPSSAVPPPAVLPPAVLPPAVPPPVANPHQSYQSYQSYQTYQHHQYHHPFQQQQQQQHPPPQKRYAVLVDSENAQRDAMPLVLQELRQEFHGRADIRRVYGDFSNTKPSWRDFCLQESFLPVHTFAYVYGKGSSDTALTMDAMELLYNNNNHHYNPPLDGFCIVSSDSDFTRLAQRLREAGKHVIGFGHLHTPEPFVRACESFVYVNDLMERELTRQKQQRDALTKQREEQVMAKIEQVEANEQAKLLMQQQQQEKEEKEKQASNTPLFQRVSDAIRQLFYRNNKKEKKDTHKAASVSQIDEKESTRTCTDTDETPNRESSTPLPPDSTKIPIPHEALAAAHVIIREHANEEGYCNPSLVAKKMRADSYGYERFRDLLADYPNDFETTFNDGSTMLVKSLKDPNLVLREKLDSLHKILATSQKEDGFANISVLGGAIQPNDYGYRSLRHLIAAYPAEFETKQVDSTFYAKSLRNESKLDYDLNNVHGAIKEHANEDGWANLGPVKMSSGVDSAEYGDLKFGSFIKRFPKDFELKHDGKCMLVKSIEN